MPVKDKENPSTNYSKKFRVILTEVFYSEAKRLAKKYPNIKEDFLELKDQLKNDPITGNDFMGDDIYKVRMQISDNKKGKSGGARVIIQVKIVDKRVYILSVYAKNSIENIIDKKLEKLKKVYKNNSK